MRENSKTFQAAVQSALAEQNLRKRLQLRTNDTHSGTMKNEEPMEIYHKRNVFFVKGGAPNQALQVQVS